MPHGAFPKGCSEGKGVCRLDGDRDLLLPHPSGAAGREAQSRDVVQPRSRCLLFTGTFLARSSPAPLFPGSSGTPASTPRENTLGHVGGH